MRIDGSGNVGIGTANPSVKLDVSGGNINTSGKLQEGGNSLIPTGAVMAFNLSSCPAGWSALNGLGGRPDARGRYVVGLSGSGTLAGTAGTALTNVEDRAVGQHNHAVDPPSTSVTVTDPGHTHNTRWKNLSAGAGPEGRTSTAEAGNGPDNISSNTTGITASVDIASFTSGNAGSVAGTNAPYIQFLLCQKD